MSQDTMLGLYTNRAREVLVQAAAESAALVGGYAQAGNDEVYFHQYAGVGVGEGGETLYLSSAEVKKRLKRRLKWYAKDAREQIGHAQSQQWRDRLEAMILDSQIILGKLSDESPGSLSAQFGEERVKAVVGQELDPFQTTAVERLQKMIEAAKAKFNEDIQSYMAERMKERDSQIAKLTAQIAGIRQMWHGGE